ANNPFEGSSGSGRGQLVSVDDGGGDTDRWQCKPFGGIFR
ncbi:hypothetical protein A2U01_0051864, partial [Trifolium medium]|nr:hypothetical protein [Trifolium medium]